MSLAKGQTARPNLASFPISTLIVLAILTSYASMTYELVIAQAIAILTDEVIWWESFTIGAFIAATGLGIFAFDDLAKNDDLRVFRQAEYRLALVGLLALPLTLFVHIYYRIYIVDYAPHSALRSPLNWVMLTCQIPNLLIGFFSGLELCALLRLVGNARSRVQIGVIALYHLGALCAALVFAVALWMKIDAFELAFCAAILNALIFFYLVSRCQATFPFAVRRHVQTGLASGLLLSLFVSVHPGWELLRELQMKNFYYNNIRVESHDGGFTQIGPVPLTGLLAWGKSVPPIERHISSYQVIDIVRSDRHEPEWKLYLDGHFQFSSETERFYHEMLAHLPVMLTRSIPKELLVLGGGDGLLARELLKYGERVHKIDLIELDKDMIHLAKALPFSSLNDRAFYNTKVRIHIADAFSWLRLSKARYEAIYIDFPYPYTFEGLRLYSVEFFNLVARTLSAQGFVMMDAPLFEAGEAGWEEHIPALLAKAGFAKVFALQGEYGETFLLALKEDRQVVWAFQDLAIPLATFSDAWFTRRSHLVELKAGALRNTNSMLKPQRISLRDVWK